METVWSSSVCKGVHDISKYTKLLSHHLTYSTSTQTESLCLDFSTSHTGLGHASYPSSPYPDFATARSNHVCELWSILRTQATPSAIPGNAAHPTHERGQRRFSPATVPWQGGALYAVSTLQEGATPDTNAQRQRKCS